MNRAGGMTITKDDLLKLGRAERIVLEYYALTCACPYYISADCVTTFAKITNKELRKIEDTLVDRHALVKGYYSQKFINKDLCIYVIINMVQTFLDDQEFFEKKFGESRYGGGAFALDFIKAVRFAIGLDSSQRVNSLSGDFMPYVMSVCSERFFQRLMLFFPSTLQLDSIETYIDHAILTDNPIEPSILENITTTLSNDRSLIDDLHDVKNLYLYILNGEYNLSEEVNLRRPYQQVLRGIRSANLGRYEMALTHFSQALKVLNKGQELKNVFYTFLPSYYLIMSYARTGTVVTTQKLEQYLRKKDITTYYQQYISVSLAHAFTSKNHLPDQFLLRKSASVMINYKPAVVLQYMSLMVAKYFGIEPDSSLWSNLYATPGVAPVHKIVAHEVSAYLDIPDSSKEELINLYGSAPMLTSIRRKEGWEWVIDDVLQQVGEETEVMQSSKAVRKERLIYVIFDRDREVQPMTQSWLKSERWGAPKNMSMKKFIECAFPYADDTDRKMANLCRIKNSDGYYYVCWPSVEEVADILVGCDRVYLSTDFDYSKPVIFQREEPYLKFVTKPDSSIAVESNVDVDSSFADGEVTTVRKGSKGVYEVITLSPRQAVVVKKLLELKKFPKGSQEQVKLMLTRLEEIIDVRSPLLDSKSIPNIDGSTSICARIKPVNGMAYTVNFMVHLVPGGSAYCYPGEGRAVVYDTVDGMNVRVKRNIQGEINAYHELVYELPFIEEDSSDNGFTFSMSIDDVLDLIEFAKDSSGRLVVEWEEGKGLSVSRATPSSWNVGLKSHNGWFEIEGEVRVDESTVMTMTQLLEIIGNSKGRYVRLSDTDYLEISGKLRKQLERIDALAVKNRNKMMISSFNAALLDDKALDGELKVAFDDRLVKLRKKIVESYDIEPKVPTALNAQLRPYQLEGYQWMVRLASWGAGACLADDMGLGKTVQTIAFLLLKASEGPALVVAPASVVPNWVGELEKFAPSLKVSVLNKTSDRAKLINEVEAYDVVLSTYGILNTEEETLSAKKWSTICLDEAHIIKNKDTKMSQAVMTLQATNRIILTGTPIQNHLGELWNLFRFINPGLLGSDESFRKKFVVPIQEHDKDRQRALQRIIKPFMLRRTKAEVVEDLPEKTDIVMPVELSDSEMAMYEAMRIKAANIIEESDKVDVNTLAEITRLRRAACSMKLVDPSWNGSESKIQAFLDLVEEFRSGSNRMLVFSQFTSFLALVREALDKDHIPYLYLDGSCSMKEREKLVGEFRKGDIPLFLISLKAGGLGLNLPEANYVTHLDPWWNPAIEQQATDRAYRIGQKRNVTVYHFVAKNTIEEKIRRLHRLKRDLADSLLEGTDMANKLGIKEILELVDVK